MRAFSTNKSMSAPLANNHFSSQLAGMHEMMQCLKDVTSWKGIEVEFIRPPKRKGRELGMMLPRLRITGADGSHVVRGLFGAVVRTFGCDPTTLYEESTPSRSDPGGYAFVPHPNDVLKVGISCATDKESDSRPVFISFGDTRFTLADGNSTSIVGEYFDEIPTLEEYFRSKRHGIPEQAAAINLGGHGDQSDVVILNEIALDRRHFEDWLPWSKSNTLLTPLSTASSWNW